MEAKVLENSLVAISQQVLRHPSSEVGLLTGKSGECLFHFHYARYTQRESLQEVAEDQLVSIIDRINSGFNNPCYADGISGVLWLISYLHKYDFVNISLEDFLQALDDYLMEHAILFIKNDNLDFFSGANGILWYLISRYQATELKAVKHKCEEVFSTYLQQITSLTREEEAISGLSSIHTDGELGVGCSTGLAHGISSCLSLLKHLPPGFAKAKRVKIAEQIIDFLLANTERGTPKNGRFPYFIPASGNPKASSNIAWCYGDLSSGTAILQASTYTNNKKYQQIALTILRDTLVALPHAKDLSVCHGNFSHYFMYEHLSLDYPREEFGQRAQKAFGKGIDKLLDAPDGINALGSDLLEGLAGIGLCVMSYLSSDHRSWSKCLMI